MAVEEKRMGFDKYPHVPYLPTYRHRYLPNVKSGQLPTYPRVGKKKEKKSGLMPYLDLVYLSYTRALNSPFYSTPFVLGIVFSNTIFYTSTEP